LVAVLHAGEDDEHAFIGRSVRCGVFLLLSVFEAAAPSGWTISTVLLVLCLPRQISGFSRVPKGSVWFLRVDMVPLEPDHSSWLLNELEFFGNADLHFACMKVRIARALDLS
jgi:hypothetical protein